MSLILLALGDLHAASASPARARPRAPGDKPLRKRFLAPLGLVAGFVDATGGGGWGPVGTPAILASGRHGAAQGHRLDRHQRSSWSRSPPASASCSRSAPRASTPAGWSALLAGGLVAAPIAAWLVRHVPPRVLGSLVGGIIVLTNTRTLLRSDWIDAPAGPRWAVYAVVYVVWAAALAYTIRAHRAEQRAEQLTPTAG